MVIVGDNDAYCYYEDEGQVVAIIDNTATCSLWGGGAGCGPLTHPEVFAKFYFIFMMSGKPDIHE